MKTLLTIFVLLFSSSVVAEDISDKNKLYSKCTPSKIYEDLCSFILDEKQSEKAEEFEICINPKLRYFFNKKIDKIPSNFFAKLLYASRNYLGKNKSDKDRIKDEIKTMREKRELAEITNLCLQQIFPIEFEKIKKENENENEKWEGKKCKTISLDCKKDRSNFFKQEEIKLIYCMGSNGNLFTAKTNCYLGKEITFEEYKKIKNIK